MALSAVGALLVMFVAWIAAGFVARWSERGMRHAKLDETVTKFVSRLVRWNILLLGALACLGVFGVQTTSFAAVLGAAGLAIGLAFQGTLSNFASGVMLLMFRPFTVGDVVKVSDHVGMVDAVDLFTTTLDTPDKRRIILPNSAVFGSTIENMTHHATRRIDVPVGVCYAANIDETREALSRAADRVQGRLMTPAPEVVLAGLGSSSVDWTVRVWVRTEDFWPVRQAAIREVKMALDRAGLEIPFPQMDIHVRSAKALKISDQRDAA